jgi:N-methylhydantoinase A/oxoprolinase/acetone carboxylase beta subunit
VITGILELLAEIGVAPGEIDVFIHGTTLANNAIIERNGAVAVANTGFRRQIHGKHQNRSPERRISIA